MPAYSALKQSSCKKCTKCVLIMGGITLALFLVLSASILSPGSSSRYPFHAECQLSWKWTNTNCSVVHKALLDQVKKWAGPENCEHGGEKCLYKIISDSEDEMKLEHTTPVKKYVDCVSFKFCGNSSACSASHSNIGVKRMKRDVLLMEKRQYKVDNGCAVYGFSKSEAWYAILDYGTNYCNMRNLAEGSGLANLPDFSEDTDDNICTLYSSANCAEY